MSILIVVTYYTYHKLVYINRINMKHDNIRFAGTRIGYFGKYVSNTPSVPDL